MSIPPALARTDLPYPGRREGKVRDIYTLPPASEGGDPRMLIVASDRLSAFDVVLPTLIPGKGKVLTAIATRWFAWIEERGLCRTHVLSTDADDLPGLIDEQRDPLRGRITIGRACKVVPIECVVRGYLAGSGWAEYRESGAICGVKLPAGLTRGAKLPEPIFTPATKAEIGEHDENIDFDRACEIAGRPLMERLREISLTIFNEASKAALKHGIVLADTKFEFGLPIGADGKPSGDEPILIDEALTPDSSRYWPADRCGVEGVEPPALDKQFVRDHLLRLVEAGQWDKTAPGPELPQHVVTETIKRYEQARDALFGSGAL
ncbi:MAG: phosphoribosylaminoimidazolesuccinocarboxamide synthase [Phycisphaeraceae bacterium]|nr:phosphoribosylaminoimidazolesuccinocarboxamide synthase [Phycisphaeraceae bacterium]MCB9847804.1 phosphoribosylaminoimidazolesuccinocarboxamide synthase [Phycisphaeraceae bacterium]